MNGGATLTKIIIILAAKPQIKKYSRLCQLQRRSSLLLELAIDEDAVLAVADEVEDAVIVEDLDVLARDEAGDAHVDVHVAARRAVAADDEAVLADEVLELLALQLGDRVPQPALDAVLGLADFGHGAFGVGGGSGGLRGGGAEHHGGGRGAGLLEGEQRQGVGL